MINIIEALKVIKDSNYWDVRFSWASSAFFVGSVVNTSLKTILPIPQSLWILLSAASGVFIMGLFAVNFKEMLKRSSGLWWRSYLFFILIYLFSALLIISRNEPLDLMLTGTAFLTFAWWIPSGIYACTVNDKKILYEVWVKASFIISFFSISMFFFHIPREIDNGTNDYNMTFGYTIILPLLIQMNEYSRKRGFLLLLLICFEIFTIIVYASRGVLLSLVFYLVYKFAFESNNRLKKIISIIFLLIASFVLFASVETVATIMVNMLDKMGYESRTLNLLATGMVSDTSGRDTIWNICFDMISKYPLTGTGLGGEYYQIAHMFEGTTQETVTADGYNPHNGIVQNFVCFGIPVGFFFTALILFPIFYLGRIKDNYTHTLLVIFISAAIIPLCVSSAGFFVKPAVAICLYLYYFSKHNYNKTKLSIKNDYQ